MRKRYDFFFSLEKERKMASNVCGKKILGTILLLSFLTLCVQSAMNGENFIERFIMYPFTVKVDTVNAATQKSIPGNNQQQLTVPVFTVNGNAQSALSPRFSSTGYGANISYNLPEGKNLAVEPDNPLQLSPLDYAKAVENRDITEIKEGFENPSSQFSELQRQQMESGADNSASLPIQSMATTAARGSKVPLVMDRFIVANMKSRRYGQGDYIRGDLGVVPVLPNSDPNSCTWFRPSVNPAVDLNPGAMAVLVGAYGDTARQTAQLQMQASSGATNTFQGVQWQPPMDTSVGQQLAMNTAMLAQKQSVSTQGAIGGDVNVVAEKVPQAATVTFFP